MNTRNSIPFIQHADFLLRQFCDRDTYRKRRSDPNGTFNRYFTIVSFDDIIGDTQSQPRSLANFLGCEERFKYLLQFIRRYSGTGIGNTHKNILEISPRPDGNDSLFFNSMGGIYQHVHEHLIQLSKIAECLGQVSVIPLYRRLVFELIPDDIDRTVDTRIDICHTAFCLIHMEKLFKSFTMLLTRSAPSSDSLTKASISVSR